jgi:hypothetical protein
MNESKEDLELEEYSPLGSENEEQDAENYTEEDEQPQQEPDADESIESEDPDAAEDVEVKEEEITPEPKKKKQQKSKKSSGKGKKKDVSKEKPEHIEKHDGPGEKDISQQLHNMLNKIKRKVEKKDLDMLEIGMHNTINEANDEISRLHEYIANVESNFHEAMEEIKGDSEAVADEVNKKLDTTKLNYYQKNLDKINYKVDNLMEDVGFGEALDVSKIPPNILEIVYQFTLDDVASALWKNLGSHDAERVIRNTLEELRLRTSSSELFRFDGRRIIAKDLGRTIEKKLVSAKQIHTTYDELIGRLLDNLPRYKAKNFRAMIKVKSQEYAVDKITHLIEEMVNVKENIANINRITVALSSSFASRLKQTEDGLNQKRDVMKGEVDERVGELNGLINTLRDSKVEVEDYDKLVERIKKIEKVVGSLSGDFMKMTVEKELGKKKKGKKDDKEENLPKKGKPLPDEKIKGKEEKTEELEAPVEDEAIVEDGIIEDKKEKKSSKKEKKERLEIPMHIVLGDEEEDEEEPTEPEPTVDEQPVEDEPEVEVLIPKNVLAPPPKRERTKFEVDQNRLFELIRGAGEKGIGISSMAKELGANNKEQKNVLIEVLKELELAMVLEEVKRGKTTYYRLPMEPQPKGKEEEKKKEEKKPAKKKSPPKKETKKKKAPAKKQDEKKAAGKRKKEDKSGKEKPENKEDKKIVKKEKPEVKKSQSKKPTKASSRQSGVGDTTKTTTKKKTGSKKKSPKKKEDKKGKKTVKQLSKDEKEVYEAINGGKNGISLTKLKKGVDVKYTILLDCLNVLLDSELISIKTKGKTTLYYRIDNNNIGGE